MRKVFVGKLSELELKKPLKVKIGKYEEAVIFKTTDGYFAVNNRCPHAGGSLHDGHLKKNILTCAWHGWKFDLETGQSLDEYWAKLTRYEVIREAENIYLLLPDNINS